ncbi:peroxiredoxin, partial [Mycobacterium sp.]|uniref:peroxiredoxin n=1 Tax=Mycobacterium sp. TaxID=1785 RepID=UPI003F9B633A
YPKDNTPGCTIEAHNFQRDLSKYTEKNAMIVGVSVDTTASHQDFCAKQSLTFKLLADPGKKVVADYGSLSDRGFASRNTFLIDPNGKIVKVWTGVKPPTAGCRRCGSSRPPRGCRCAPPRRTPLCFRRPRRNWP